MLLGRVAGNRSDRLLLFGRLMLQVLILVGPVFLRLQMDSLEHYSGFALQLKSVYVELGQKPDDTVNSSLLEKSERAIVFSDPQV